MLEGILRMSRSAFHSCIPLIDNIYSVQHYVTSVAIDEGST